MKTIHVPKNLSQLSGVLPKSKYEDEKQNNFHFPKSKFERSKSTRKIAERQNSGDHNDRNNIIEMAQKIKLPPIREIESQQSIRKNHQELQ